ncbi:MAG TPA: homoserine dehydrogenase [Spirochaetia bacterium]|nr:MAG: hypothetical protein A2Y41_12410 [Spirochaetes bacterium GWB1_36_13]HCL57688.1 homoserine dehydrogenase [Spirochaetia bacterium]
MQKVKCALIGFGTIGGGVYDLLNQNKNLITERTGIDFQIKYIIDKDLTKIKNIKGVEISDDYQTALKDPEIEIVIELVGGTQFPYILFNECMKSGKHFITANKALLSERLYEMFEKAQEQNKYIGFEASVAGGIPIIQTIRTLLIGNKIQSIKGIINGTTNYILTKMSDEKLDFQIALKKAQELGFAEADPTLDLNGGDAASKLAVLASIAFNQNIKKEDVFTEGIENIELTDIQYAKEFNYIVKLIASSSIDESGKVEVRVQPMMVSEKNPLSSVKNEFNSILVDADFLGQSMYYGRGAGAYPTASAVVSDIVDIGNKIISKKEYNNHFFSISKDKKLKQSDELQSEFYMRIMTGEKPGILAKIGTVLGDHGISIAAVFQKDSDTEEVPVVFKTHQATEKQFQDSLKIINKFDFVKKLVYYRILN